MLARAGWMGASLALAVLVAPGSATAHGRFPATGQIAFHPADPDTVVVRATFGVLVTKDGGDSWRWICIQALGARMTEDPDIAVMADGSILAAMFDGMARGADVGCDWSFPDADLEGVVTIDQERHPTDPSTSLTVTSSGGVDNLVFRSEDDGLTWEPTGDPIDPILFETIAIAPSNPDVVYLTGAYPPTMTEPRRPFVYRSEDGAATWESFAWDGLGEGDRNIFLLGVDPTDPMHLFMRVQSENDDRLMRSTDGGESWVVAETVPDISGFAWSEDGSTVWFGGLEATGLWRSDDGGEGFEQLTSELDIGCLASRGDELWACGNNFTDGFSIGISMDGGESFESVLLFDEIDGIVECPGGGVTPATCEPHLADLEADLGIGMDGGVGMGDGGGDGCSCSAPGSGPPAAGAWLAAVFVGLIAVRRRRRGLG